MSEGVDFVVKSPDNQPQLFVEATSSLSPRKSWAAHMRKVLVQNSALSPSAYFILARPDEVFFWKKSDKAGTVQPDFSISTAKILGQYLSSEASLGDLSEETFEMVVRTWLEDLVKATENPAGIETWLIESGLYDKIRNGNVARG